MDRPEAGTVTGSHVLVEGLNCVAAAHLTVLLVHVVSAGARVVTDPDTEVLDLEGVLLGDLTSRQYPSPSISSMSIPTHLVQRNDLTVGLLDLSELGEEVPETALGDDIVRGEDAHAVELWGWVGVGGQMTPNDLVFLQAACGQTGSARCLMEDV